MSMRSCGAYGFCEECGILFASTQKDQKGTITHPTWDQWPDMNPMTVELYRKCPNAGKKFKHPLMEEVK